MAKPKTHKKPRIGMDNKKSPKSKALKKKLTKKHQRREGKKESKVEENFLFSNFLKHLGEKNYSAANKYLRGIVEAKLKSKIAQFATQNIFE